MPIPLIWLGAGLAVCYATGAATKEFKKVNSNVRFFPGEGKRPVSAEDGAIVCCGIYGLFEHTGIWIDNTIIELKGNGLIRAISPERFLQNRSGEHIYIACDQRDRPLIEPLIIQRAASKLYQYSEYHVLDNNCHRFVWKCLSDQNHSITSFSDLNQAIFKHFKSTISWQPLN